MQGTKLKQLQHFLSWNNAKIQHSCKSQLYKNFDSHQLPPRPDVVHVTVGMTRGGILLVEELSRWNTRVT